MRVFKLFLVISLIWLLQCGFTLVREGPNPWIEIPKGAPDPKEGIVLRHNSDAHRFLNETSENIRWIVSTTFGTKVISSLYIPMKDKIGRRFRYFGKNLNLELESVHKFDVFFGSKGKIWKGASFYRHEPYCWLTEEEAQMYLEEWANRISEMGWPVAYGPKTWSPEGRPRQAYMGWSTPYTRLNLAVLRGNTTAKKLRNYIVVLALTNRREIEKIYSKKPFKN